MKKIGVVGSINLDLSVVTDRIPLRGETLPGRDVKEAPGGKGANQAVAAAKLGGDVTMFGCVGRDSFGDRLLENLKAQGVKTGEVARTEKAPTGLAMITVGGGDNTIVVAAGANGLVTPAYLEERREKLLACDILLLQNEIPMETVLYAARLCHAAGKFVLYDPAPAMPGSQDLLGLADCLTPNESEAALLFPGRRDREALLREYPQKLVVTLGEQGVAAALADGSLLRLPPRRSQVVDTTGAGDAFNGALAYALAEGRDFASALAFANTAAGLSTEAYGAQAGAPRLDQVLEALPG